MNINEMTAQILNGSSPRYVIESSAHHRWEQLGKKLDAIIRTGGVMASAASPIALAYAHGQELKAQRLSFGPPVQAHAAGHVDVATAMAGRAPGFEPETMAVAGRSVIAATGRAGKAQLAAAALAGVGVVGMLGAAGAFRRLGMLVDKRKFVRALKSGIRQLIKDADPSHKREISEITTKLAVTDPFTNPKKYSALLRLLSTKLASYRDIRYNQHIESIHKFLEVLP